MLAFWKEYDNIDVDKLTLDDFNDLLWIEIDNEGIINSAKS